MLITAIKKEKEAIFGEGKREGKIEVAKVLLSLGQDIGFIQKATSLPKATIEKLRKEINN